MRPPVAVRARERVRVDVQLVTKGRGCPAGALFGMGGSCDSCGASSLSQEETLIATGHAHVHAHVHVHVCGCDF